MNENARRLELDKILSACASHAVLEAGKARLLTCEPTHDLAEARRLLDLTQEATLLLFTLGAGKVEDCPPCEEALERAEKGASLSMAELLGVARLLRSARVLYRAVQSFSDERIVRFQELTEHLMFDERLEEDIGRKILNENELSDHASEKLFSLRTQIRQLGERIRTRLQGYLAGEERKFLQDGIVTVRGDRFVIPVKAEYKRSVRGFVHDRSQSGATVFIEPEEVLEMNNELRSLMLDEKEEVAHILAELSHAVGRLRGALVSDMDTLAEADAFYARAEYGYRLHAVKPDMGGKGILEIIKGRHPLLDQKTAVPVSLALGEEHRFLLISGANTGGKTVTLKMCGLFCLMAACGLFVPAAEGTRLSVFDGVWCDIGDSQSIEENLSTFSSHVVHIKEILECATEKSLVLIDEPGGGTDPEEGAALARAVVSQLLRRGCRGVVTTHYTALKEFAYSQEGIENGCMEFDAADFRPLYRLKIGAPGSSNALLICTRLGLPASVVEEARGYLSEGARAFEHTLRAAEESRVRTEEATRRAREVQKEWETRLSALAKEEEAFRREKDKFLASSKAEARRIVTDRTARAEELLAEMETIFRKNNLTEADLIRARTLKNRMGAEVPAEETPVRALPVDAAKLKAGDRVLVGAMGTEGTVLSVRRDKGTCDVQTGLLRVSVKISDLYTAPKSASEAKGAKGAKNAREQVRVTRNLTPRPSVKRECNLIGMTTSEGVAEAENFLDAAVVANLQEVRIVHGYGTGKLRAAIQDMLRRHPRVESFRLGKYGEGEAGVTIVTLK